jgi:(2Fe-2S) ferredoxin
MAFDYPLDIFKLFSVLLRAQMAQRLRELEYLTTHTSLSPIRCEVAPGFVYYKKVHYRNIFLIEELEDIKRIIKSHTLSTDRID